MLKLTAATAALVLAAGSGAALAHRDVGDTVRFDRTGGNHPTSVHRIIVNGSNCFEAEDLARLVLVDWDPANDRVVYRCVQP